MTINTRFVIAAVSTIALDIATKVAAVRALSDGSVDLGVIELRLVRNSGVAFGFGTSLAPIALVGVTGAVIVALAVAVGRKAVPAGLPTGLILGGALANLVDRLTGGSVIDMLDLGWWPAFNLADVFIVVGVSALLLDTPPPQPVAAEGSA